MKTTILLTTVLLFVSSLLHAQIEKGKVQIGGSFDFGDYHLSQTPAANYTSFSIHPSVGHFYATNKLVGVFLNFFYSENNNSSGKSYGGGLYFRQYKAVVKALYVFAEEDAGITYNRYRINSSTSGSYEISANTRPGIAYDLTKRMQLEMAYANLLGVNYSYTKAVQIFTVNSNLEGSAFQNLLVGFRFYLK